MSGHRNSMIRLGCGSMVRILARRQGSLDLLADTRGIGSAAELSLAPPSAKLVLRCRPDGAAAAGRIFGIALPHEGCRASVGGDRAALWLGPDEWLLFAAEGDAAAIAGKIETALTGMTHSCLDVSHRSCG